MAWWQELLKTTIQTGIWALAIYLLGKNLGAHCVKTFEAVIGRAIDRVRKAGPVELESITAIHQSGIDGRLEIETVPAVSTWPKDSVVAQFETEAREWIRAAPPSEREERAIQGAVWSRLYLAFENINYSVLGSQLDLLQRMNSESVALEQARGIYERAVESFPEYYRNYSFDAWIGWLTTTSRLMCRRQDAFELTYEGREFLRFLIWRAYPLTRLG